MIKFFRFKLNIKIFLSFFIIIIITSFFSLLINYQLIKNISTQEIEIRLNNSISAYYQEIKFIENQCLNIAKAISNNDEIINLFSNKKYALLEKKLISYYKMGIIDIIEIENLDGKVVLRGHNPSLAGDIKSSQSIIQSGLSGKDEVSYEKGKSGFAIRAVSPIRINNRVMGLVMIGSLFSKNFIDHIKLLTGIDNGIYKDNLKIIANYNSLNKLSNSIIEKLNKNENIFFIGKKSNNEDAYYMLKPLFLKNNIYWGALCMGILKNEENKYLKFTRNILILMISIGSIFSLTIYFFLAKNINNSLKKIISGINGFNINKFDTKIILKQNDEFKIIADSFNNLVKKLLKYYEKVKKLQEDMIKSAKLAIAGQIAAGVAHEIRNPLSSIKMMAQIVRDRNNKNNELKEINTILYEIEKINNLVKDLLVFAKPKAMKFRKHNINNILRNILNLFKYNIKHQNINLNENYDKNLPDIYLDEEKVRLCLINIVLNAIQAMHNGGDLNIETILTKKNRVLIKIIDTGIGIEESNIKTIFEPFFTTKKEGTGLGLALAKLIVERHNGEIKVKSKKNRTIFIINLPQFINEKNIL